MKPELSRDPNSQNLFLWVLEIDIIKLNSNKTKDLSFKFAVYYVLLPHINCPLMQEGIIY